MSKQALPPKTTAGPFVTRAHPGELAAKKIRHEHASRAALAIIAAKSKVRK